MSHTQLDLEIRLSWRRVSNLSHYVYVCVCGIVGCVVSFNAWICLAFIFTYYLYSKYIYVWFLKDHVTLKTSFAITRINYILQYTVRLKLDFFIWYFSWNKWEMSSENIQKACHPKDYWKVVYVVIIWRVQMQKPLSAIWNFLL